MNVIDNNSKNLEETIYFTKRTKPYISIIYWMIEDVNEMRWKEIYKR